MSRHLLSCRPLFSEALGTSVVWYFLLIMYCWDRSLLIHKNYRSIFLINIILDFISTELRPPQFCWWHNISSDTASLDRQKIPGPVSTLWFNTLIGISWCLLYHKAVQLNVSNQFVKMAVSRPKRTKIIVGRCTGSTLWLPIRRNPRCIFSGTDEFVETNNKARE